jgi:type I restriction enzyme S subunit
MREDWIECKFGDIITFKNGYAFKSTRYLKSGIPVIRIGDIKENEVLIEDAICVDENKDLKEYEIVKDDILIAMSGATTGKFGRYNLNRKAYLNQRVGNIKPLSDKYIYKSFLFYLLSQLKREIERSAYGGAQPNISSKKIEELAVAFAPLPEQRAIVKKLESLFSSLDAGVADLKKAEQQLKIYRQAVLKKAFEGITETIILNDAGVWKGGGTPSTQNKDFWENGNINWVSSQDVKTKYIEDTERKITGVAIENSSTKWIEKNALLFVVRSGILRRIFPIGIAKVNLCVNQDIQTLTLNEKYLTEFVYWYLMSNEYDIRHNCAKDGTTVESIDVSKLKKYKLPACTLEEQNEIVKQIESRLSVCDSIEQNIKESLEKAEALRQSILKKAFEGNLLTAQELAACKQAVDYEPANVLVERIKAEHKGTVKAKK